MAEGGIYPWKLQKIKQPNNGLPGTCRFADLSKPLPDPPKGLTWVQDESTKEWKLIPMVTATVAASDANNESTAIAVAVEQAVPIHPNKTTSYAATGIQYHKVLPTDTFQGICLRYKVTPMELRRTNKMMGSNLKLAPENLVIPCNGKNLSVQQRMPTEEEKIASLIAKVSPVARKKITYSEARSYLEIRDWDVKSAIEDVNEDFGP